MFLYFRCLCIASTRSQRQDQRESLKYCLRVLRNNENPKTAASVLTICTSSLWIGFAMAISGLLNLRSWCFPLDCNPRWSVSVPSKTAVGLKRPRCVAVGFCCRKCSITLPCYSCWISHNWEGNLCGAVSCETVYKWLKHLIVHTRDFSCQSCFVLPPFQLPFIAPLESNPSRGEDDWKKDETQFSTGVKCFYIH